jgi:YHS domain-containing protein
MKRVLAAFAMAALCMALAIAAEVNLKGVKCPVNEKENASPKSSADYKGGKVYFCCDSCSKSLKDQPEKYAAKANQQLVATGQAVQTKCPVSGEAIKKDVAVEIGGAKVYLCCNDCKEKIAKAKGEEQLNLAFSEPAWKKSGYKVGK